MKHGSEQNLGYLLTQASNIWNRRLMEIFRAKGYDDLKPSFGAVFIPLFDKDKQSITDIMNFSKLTKQTMSIYVGELGKKGYINTNQDNIDKRRIIVSLTTKGKKLKSVANRAVKQVNDEFRKQLNTLEFKHFLRALEKIIST